MKFSSKVLACILGLTLSGAAAVCLLDYHLSSNAMHQQFWSHYRTLGESLGSTFTQLEAATDTTLLNALHAFTVIEARDGLAPTEELAALAETLNVTEIGAYDRDGMSEVFSNAVNAKGAVDLFALCGDYRKLFTGETKSVLLPFAPKIWANNSGYAAQKYAFAPSTDNKHILAVTVLTGNIAAFLREAVAVDKSILGIGMYTQDGTELALALSPEHNASQRVATPLTVADVDHHKADAAVFSFVVASSVATCCECVTKGVLKDANDTSYRMRVTVSMAGLQAAAKQRRNEALAIFAVLAVLSASLGRWLASRLVRRIEKISETTRMVLETGDLSLQADEGQGDDEVTLLARGFNTMMRTLNENEAFRAEKASMAAIAKVASQAAHDIRSPVAALQVVADCADSLEEDQRLLVRGAIRRISDIANNLLTKHRTATKVVRRQDELVAPILQSIVSEQRVVHAKRDVDFAINVEETAYRAFAAIEVPMFRRVVSNIMNNSSDAIKGGGLITIGLRSNATHLFVSIADDGCGIAPENIAKVMRGGHSIGKADGNGLGLSTAIEAVEAWDGRVDLTSELGKGTTVTLMLPLRPAASWFADAITLRPHAPVFVLDDDEAMGRVWRKRLSSFNVPVHVFRQVDKFSAAVTDAGETLGTCLVDYELIGENVSGLDVVRALGVQKQSLLITSHYEEDRVRTECAALGMQIVPKAFTVYVPVNVQVSKKRAVS